VIQLAAIGALPVIVSAAGRPGLTVTTVAVTIGLLLLWLWARLRTPGHLAVGILLIAVADDLALGLAGSTLTATAGLVIAVILTASAVTGFRALAGGTLGPATVTSSNARSVVATLKCRIEGPPAACLESASQRG
jgi:hypothetical protein